MEKEEEEGSLSIEEIRIIERYLRENARENSQFHLSRKLSEIHQNLNRLNSGQSNSEIRLVKLQDQLRERQGELKRRQKLNETARSSLTGARVKNVIEQRDRLLDSELPRRDGCRKELNRRRSELVVDLSTIYPIEPISSSSSSTSISCIDKSGSGSRLLLFSIANIILPILEPTHSISNKPCSSSSSGSATTTGITGTTPSLIQFFHSRPPDLADDDFIVSTALGFVAHLVQLLALYLAVPLLYPVNFLGSRSLVSDLVSRIPGPRSFPLYFKGVDRFRFEYAVFLLNKNIEQIMYHQKVVVSDLKHTLPNLKNLFLTLESSPITPTGENENDSIRTIELAISENNQTEVEGGEEESVLKNSSSSNTRPEEDSQPLLPPRVTQSHSFSASSSSSKATERLPSSSHDVPSDDHDERVQQNKDVGAPEQNDHQLSSSKSYPYSSSPLSPPLSPPPSKTTLQQQIKHQANQIHPHNSSCSTSPSPTALTTTTDTDPENHCLHHNGQVLDLDPDPNHLSNMNGTPRQSEKNITSTVILHPPPHPHQTHSSSSSSSSFSSTY
ncbi:hypothetical protein MJO28_007712 [Puccinia striiformis f. sp. tritici]|uniref:Uncharacterized protein n=2 Tax=Puccinia striiformis TaxID=27350 RepID=A0A2S4VJS8_9BASI|nr:hypothetical protein Pst134EA_013805 [Puccinia striiformis f. sp. tritici]KAI9612865.1 hypothetical protein KEM48_003940 [Puccinia striiformis f. sp. tritici PST-130]POW09801.1 hypothetical protein PSTT_06582 [Puccinia striiformis]KAH9454704.1 hypothetical protein Pst134EB_014768 [Puccinia striiformis f. sp. tritici]KAH9465950.1 hypothetical protein Pst134EA_013805 [Puccinia striiformis f. sp. tritici]KAI7952028.1 hypothetical protein MJO28_007712 [Puccinia striiformis f. sp. tritici]